MIQVDGSRGEGGGQVLRTSLALSLVTGAAFRMVNIRAGRSRPGLLRQHLTAVEAAAAVGQAEVEGAALGSQELVFRPRGLVAGAYRFAVGTAGSATLVLQTVLPALLGASGPSTLELEGGTHNSAAPPFDFLERAYLPLVGRMGPRVAAVLERPGFYPAGGGRMRVQVEPASLRPLWLPERGAVRQQQAVARVANLPRNVAWREVQEVGRLMGWGQERLRVEEVKGSAGPGNVLVLEVESEQVTEVFTGFGEKGVRAEAVAEGVCAQARAYLEAGVPVGEHLCDQLLLLLALARGGGFRTLPLDGHAQTQLETFKHFLDVRVSVAEVSEQVREVEVKG